MTKHKREDAQLDLDLVDKPVVVLGPLDGPSGNAFSIMGECRHAWRQAFRDTDEPGWKRVYADLISGDYEHLLDVVERNFTVLGTAVVVVDDWRDRSTCDDCGHTDGTHDEDVEH